MYRLCLIWLLATVLSLTADVTHYYYMIYPNLLEIPCNWRVAINCNESSVIKILNITVVNTTCNGQACNCPFSLNNSINTDSDNRTIPEYITDKCHNKTSCNSVLPHPGILDHKQMTKVTLHHKCTGTSLTSDTSTSNGTRRTTGSVSSSPTTHADDSSSEDSDMEKQSSSLNVVSAVVPTVLVSVVITLVTLVIIARRQQTISHASDKAAIPSADLVNVLQRDASSEANQSVNINGVRHSTMADDNDEYNAINLITFPLTDVPTYSDVNSYISNPHCENNNVSSLIDSDYASCADIVETVIVDDTYSHITNNTHASNEINSNQGLTANLSQSGYDFIELANFNGIHADESKLDENTYSYIGIDILNGRSLVDVNQYGSDYSHIGHVARGSEAECSTNNPGNVSEARSKSNVGGTCKTKTVNQVNSENYECKDIHSSNESAYGSGNEINGADIENDRLYQLKECDHSGESNHFYYILEKKQ